MNTSDFYTNLDLRYPEIAICLEDVNEGKGKFYIPVLTPLLNKSEPYDIKDTPVSKKNILSNQMNLDIKQCNLSNYIYLDLLDNKPAKKGQQFIVIFIGGDANKPRLIGRY